MAPSHAQLPKEKPDVPPDTARLTLVLGGARSGKSRHAEQLITTLPPPWTYVATAQALDDEMAARIAEHRSRRDPRWHTVEAPLDVAGAIETAGTVALVDCLTLWLSNLMLSGADMDAATERLEQRLARATYPVVLVANEVGLGIVPDNALARRFRDAAGRLNQTMAARADRVVLMVAGIPMQVK
jgi:adenosylcobinamide kinase / adenosylcobinamide-phosphate guanylyltransferase